MPRSVVELTKLNALDAAIRAFDSDTGESMAAFHDAVMNLLSQFEGKRDVLFEIRRQALNAYNSCKRRRAFDSSISCAGLAEAYYRADKRYSKCAKLVEQAQHAISEYDSCASQFCQAKTDLCSRANVGIERVSATIEQYNSNLTPETGNVITGNGPLNSTVSANGQNQGNNGGVFMAAAGTTSGKDMAGQANLFEHLPPIAEPNKENLQAAAKDIAESLKGEGTSIGTKELLLQQKADAVFEQQYGISKTDLIAATGPQKMEYIDAYNKIQKGILLELKLL